MRQFVAVAFRAGDRRTYTYHNDGAPVAIGDRVLIEKRGGGEQAVTVAEISDEDPRFQTKPILGLAPADPETEEASNNGQ